MKNLDVKMFKTENEYSCYLFNLKKGVKIMNINELANKTAEELLQLSNQVNSIPVDVKAILKRLGISALPFDFSELEEKLNESDEYKGSQILGAIVTKNDKCAIFYSNSGNDQSHRTRFTIAHELAHCCLHGLDANFHVEFRINTESNDPKEVAANTFAGELLIPTHSLNSVLKKLIYPTLQVLSDIFDVSKNVMKKRLEFLGLTDKVYIPEE